MNNHHKKKTVVDHPGNHAVLRTLLNGVILIFSVFFVLWTKCNHLLCKISYSGQYKIKKTCILYDRSYFKIAHIFTDPTRGSQTFKQCCIC